MGMFELSQYELSLVSGGAGLEGENAGPDELDGQNNDGSFND